MVTRRTPSTSAVSNPIGVHRFQSFLYHLDEDVLLDLGSRGAMLWSLLVYVANELDQSDLVVFRERV